MIALPFTVSATVPSAETEREPLLAVFESVFVIEMPPIVAASVVASRPLAPSAIVKPKV